jgi:hypothetical protein
VPLNLHAGESQAFEQAGRVFLVAAESVQRLGEDYIESAIQRIPHQRLKTGAEKRRTGDGVIPSSRQGYFATSIFATHGGRSPAQAGSRCLEDLAGGGQVYCRWVRST